MFLFKNPNGFYYLYYNCNLTGKRVKISTKTKLKSDALIYLNSFRFNTTKKRENKIKPILISDLYSFLKEYLQTDLNKKTLLIYESALNNLVKFTGIKPFESLTIREIENYKNFRLNKIKATSLNIELRTLKATGNKAVKLGLINLNPFADIKQIPIPDKSILCFSDSEIRSILKFPDTEKIKNVVLVSLYTGMRINEVLNLQWKNVNFEAGYITVSNKDNFKTKTGKNRNIPINEGLKTLLNNFFETELLTGNIAGFDFPDKYIFRKKMNIKFSTEYVSKKFKSVLRKLNFPEKFHFHCLRHTFITNLVNAGANINHIKEIAGHCDIKTTLNYVHLQNKDLIHSINKLKINY